MLSEQYNDEFILYKLLDRKILHESLQWPS